MSCSPALCPTARPLCAVCADSASKFLGGHADALGGIAAGDTKMIREVYHWREIHGACLDPHAAYMLLRGLKTLQLRVERQNASAMMVAEYLMEHPAVRASASASASAIAMRPAHCICCCCH